jgi:hypothetical protein
MGQGVSGNSPLPFSPTLCRQHRVIKMVAHRSRVLLFLLLVLIVSYPVSAQNTAAQPKFSSAFTDLGKECKNAFKRVGEGQDMPLKCKGYGQYYMYIYYSAFASHISIKTNNGDDFIYLSPEKIEFSDQKNNKIEWRLADGKPFAVILKVSRYDDKAQDNGENPYQDKYKIGELFIIKGLKGYEHINFEVDAQTTPEAITKARELADNAFLKSRP